MSMEIEDVKKYMESVLLAYGEAISIRKLAQVIGVSQNEIRQGIEYLRGEYLDRKSGFAIIEKDDEIQLVTHPDCAIFVRKSVRGDMSQSLTSAALEVLSIVAYRGPVARAEIEAIRGVNCSFILRNLLVRGLVERIESTEDSRLFLYKSSCALLRLFGMSTIEQLPEYEFLRKDTRIENATQHPFKEN